MKLGWYARGAAARTILGYMVVQQIPPRPGGSFFLLLRRRRPAEEEHRRNNVQRPNQQEYSQQTRILRILYNKLHHGAG